MTNNLKEAIIEKGKEKTKRIVFVNINYLRKRGELVRIKIKVFDAIRHEGSPRNGTRQ